MMIHRADFTKKLNQGEESLLGVGEGVSHEA